MRTAWRILAVVALLALVCGRALAQETAPTMTVAAGFDGYCREGAWCPVYVTLSNQGPDLEAELRFSERPAFGGQLLDVYRRPVTLPNTSRKAYTLFVPADSLSELEVALVVDGDPVASQSVTVRSLRQAVRLYGVVASTPSDLNFLADVVPAGAQGAVAHLDLERLPSNPLGWAALDVLVLNDVDTSALETGQRQALETWLAQGGHLIVGGGAGASQTAAGLGDLLPVTVGAVRRLDDLDGLGQFLGVPVAADGPYPVVDATLTEGEVLVEQDGMILVARRWFGAGSVDFLAFDAGLNPFSRWEHGQRLWLSLLDIGASSTFRLHVEDPYSASRVVEAIPDLKPPSVLQILGFLLAYTLLIGPANYLVLRRLDRRELAWLTIPAIVVVFTACAYVTGFQIRGRVPVLHRLAVVYVPEDAETGHATQLVGLFSPRRTRYDVEVPDGGVRRIPGGSYMPTDVRPMEISQAEDGWAVEDVRVDIGAIHPFIVDGIAEVSRPLVDLELALDPKGVIGVEGSITGGDIPLEDAVLVVGSFEHYLGDLATGQTIAHSPAGGTSLLFGSRDWWSTALPMDWDEAERNRRRELLNTFFPTNQSILPSGVYLAGWAPEAPLDVAVAGSSADTIDLTLYIFELPVSPETSDGAVVIPPELIRRRMIETDGVVDVVDSIQLSPNASVTFEFRPWSGLDLGWVEGLVVELGPWETGSLVRPEVALWDWDLERWTVETVDWGANEIPTPHRYVSDGGTVRLELRNEGDLFVEFQDLSITIRGQR